MDRIKYYKLIDIESLEDQLQMIANRKNVTKEAVCKYRWKNFFHSVYKATKFGKATTTTIRKIKHIWIDVSKLLSEKDRIYIFWK